MANPPPYPDPGEGPGIPRWVKVAGIVVAVLVLLFVMVQLVGGGHRIPQHGLGLTWLVPAPAQYLR